MDAPYFRQDGEIRSLFPLDIPRSFGLEGRYNGRLLLLQHVFLGGQASGKIGPGSRCLGLENLPGVLCASRRKAVRVLQENGLVVVPIAVAAFPEGGRR